MQIRIGLELNNEGRALAWALDFPGCFAYGAEGPEAIIALAPALAAYQEWVNRHAGRVLVSLGDFDLRLVETWDVYTIDDNYELSEGGYAVNAWFKQDWKPLSAEEVERGIDLLTWMRADLLELAAGIQEEQLVRVLPGERWPVRGVLRHIANAEWWYLDRLNLAGGPRDELPKPFAERLAAVRSRLLAVLPELVDQNRVVGVEGEFWSPRKLLRRVLWHEIDHYHHIEKLLAA